MKNYINLAKAKYTALLLAIFGLVLSAQPAKADIAADIIAASTSLTGYANSIATLVVALAVIVGGALFVRGLIKRV